MIFILLNITTCWAQAVVHAAAVSEPAADRPEPAAGEPIRGQDKDKQFYG